MTLIGIAGRKGSGKDTAASVLLTPKHNFENVKFAGALKAMMYTYFAYLGQKDATRFVDGNDKELALPHTLCGKTARFAMQTLGTEWGRELIGSDIWLNAFQARAEQFDNVVCTDMRFPNEVELIKSLGGVTVRIVDPDFVPPSSDGGSEHPSEALIDDLVTDFVVVNRKSTIDKTVGGWLPSHVIERFHPTREQSIAQLHEAIESIVYMHECGVKVTTATVMNGARMTAS